MSTCLCRPDQELWEQCAEPRVITEKGGLGFLVTLSSSRMREGGLSWTTLGVLGLGLCFWDVSGELVKLLGWFCDKSKGLGWFSLLSFLRTERTKLPFSVKSSGPARRG